MWPVVELGMWFGLTSHSVGIALKPFGLQEVSLNETCNEGSTVRYLCDVYRSEFCVEQEDVSVLFRLKCATVYGIGEGTENEKSLKLNETLDSGMRHLRVCPLLMILIYLDINQTFYDGNGRGSLLFASNEVSLVANAEVKVRKMRKQRCVNKCFEILKYLEQHQQFENYFMKN
jgi:hypothetical protein